MAYEVILYETDGPVATITLNRPEELNAYTAQMGAELADAVARADEDDAVGPVILTGAGRRRAPRSSSRCGSRFPAAEPANLRPYATNRL
jgi:1,4-dihydroxy-2-naphthoyl-CoA synthase